VAKFNRQYQLLIETEVKNEFIEIKLPFTIEFEITKNYLASQNEATIRVMNLGVKNRNRIRFDFYDITDQNKRKVILRAGYEGFLADVFVGFINFAHSERSNQTFVTTIVAFDGGFAFNTPADQVTYNDGTPVKQIVSNLMDQLIDNGINKGVVGNIEGTIKKSYTPNGTVTDAIRELTGQTGFFVDGNVSNFLNDSESLGGDIQVIDAETGLLNTPMVSQLGLQVDILFEPRLRIGQVVRLNTLTGDLRQSGFTDYQFSYNGDFRINSIQHSATISEAVSGEAFTSIGLSAGKFTGVI
jgi:hypothetical protein